MFKHGSDLPRRCRHCYQKSVLIGTCRVQKVFCLRCPGSWSRGERTAWGLVVMSLPLIGDVLSLPLPSYDSSNPVCGYRLLGAFRPFLSTHDLRVLLK